ncbi:MAG: hypothetical protein ACLS20_05965 [Faecalimonas umbilicata]|uniref:hypothetical protein n=1 Tax=Faecalimonas umbilicata TaxID=1912855 RepID=UPI0039929A15
MTNRFLRRVVSESIIDTRKYRYTYNAGNGNIERLTLNKLNTTEAISSWGIVGNIKHL